MATAAAAGLASGAAAQGQSGPVAPMPELKWVFAVRVEVGPTIEQGEIDGGAARFIPITGGQVYGPRLKGTVLPGGGDWQVIRNDGLTDIEARYFLKAEDGTVIEVHNPGVRVADEATIEKLRIGEPVEQESYYFRTQPRFRVADGPHQWLERQVFVARGVRFPDRVIIDFYSVE
ncbi:DUF3237 domain-containing protein [Sphingopyxis indica]|uniref:DUF3237 domain-containing protein n=1 Tax=Sphingopyxis indica TaxID=436663 RepID=UPI002938F1FB|nr:DUF3237 domain-containing protein [Sphingopyxis indica]